jgi:hypothetical protein
MSRRTPLVVLGAVVLAFAGFAVVAGIVLTVAFPSGDALMTGSHPVRTPTRALVSEVAELNGLTEAPAVLGQARVEVEAVTRAGEGGVFVGVGRAADVDRYLAVTDVDVMTRLEAWPFRLTTRHQSGAGVPPPPGSQDFWVARAEAGSGTARVSWPMQDGDFRVVFMKADGTPGVDVDVRFAVVLPAASRISLTVLAAGLGMALLGGLALTLGLLAPRPASPQPPSAAFSGPPVDRERVGPD